MQAPDFTKYYRYDECADLLRAMANDYPNLASLESIGKSYEGRDIWALTVTNAATGDPLDKPGFYIDGNIHGSEVTASTACLYIAWHLLSTYEDNSETTALVDENAFYLIPMVSPDGVEFCLSTPGRVRSGTRMFPYEEERDG
ncbi:MAG: M14 family zinc carboxypeptidase, partial [Candidatus Poribacteria bacterium]|nr:M14 family zinc carboxypeptidase [Candidatus Poribacteria bacterium]